MIELLKRRYGEDLPEPTAKEWESRLHEGIRVLSYEVTQPPRLSLARTRERLTYLLQLCKKAEGS